jgi:glycosyltransferase involved in cell wall biosynthesis
VSPGDGTSECSGRSKKRILFIQHASALGGSCVSLLETIFALDKNRYEAVVALARPSEAVHAYYSSAGIRVVPWQGVTVWNHSTVAPTRLGRPASWVHLARVAFCWRRDQKRTLGLVARAEPHLVHLNSMPLAVSARALSRARIPFVWHVREPPEPERGLRYRIIRRLMLEARNLIFLSESDRNAWVQSRSGVVIPNFVNLDRINGDLDRKATRERLGLPPAARVVLFAGGLAEVKGIHPLLEAIAMVRGTIPNVVCLMPGSGTAPSGRPIARFARAVLPLVGSGTPRQRVEARIRRLNLAGALLRLPFCAEMPTLLAVSDVVAFPSIKPHFARPVIEAAAMGKPAVGSDLPGVRELIQDGKTGFLVPAGSPAGLAGALIAVLADQALADRLGQEARRVARERFDARRAVANITDLYDRVAV